MAFLPLRFLRRKMSAYGLFPRSVLAQLTVYLLVLVLGLYVAEKYSQLHSARPAAGSAYGPWILGLGSITAFFLVILFFRWVRQVVMWRLRNRLIITYLFIGVVPISLLTLLVLFAAYLFAGQFATFLADDRLRTELHGLNAANQTVAAQIAASVRRGGSPADEVRTLLPGQEAIATQFPKRSLIAFYRDEPVLSQQPTDAPVPPIFAKAPPSWMQSDYEGVVTADGMQLYLAVASTARINGQKLAVVSFVPVDNSLTERLAQGLGRVDFMRSGLVGFNLQDKETGKVSSHESSGSSVTDGSADQQTEEKLGATSYLAGGGKVPDAYSAGDRQVNFTTPYLVRDWKSGNDRTMLLSVQTRPSILYAQLFATSLVFAKLIFGAILLVAIIFAFFLIVAVLIGLGLTRRITASVSRLYRATQHINRGDFTHRIEVTRADQLAALEGSFNSMTQSIERLLREQKEKERLESELAIAQQVQAQLFPKDDLQITTLEIHGVCHPAQTVSGDYYDFLPLGNDKLGIAVGDISGKGISAALLMATVHSAVRVFEFGGAPMQRALAAAVPQASGAAGITARNGHHHIPPAQVLTLLNRHLYQSTPEEKYATLFLSMYDGATRTLTYSNGGHLPPLLISRDGIRKLEDGGTVVGLLDNMAYEEKSVVLQPGELFLAYSDGITEPENEFGEFGEHRLLQLVRENFDLPLARLSEVVVNAVNDWIGSAVQPDDLTLVLARAR